jgi:hypothetical protein
LIQSNDAIQITYSGGSALDNVSGGVSGVFVNTRGGVDSTGGHSVGSTNGSVNSGISDTDSGVLDVSGSRDTSVDSGGSSADTERSGVLCELGNVRVDSL